MSATLEIEREKRFDWPVCYEAENWVLEQIDGVCARYEFVQTLRHRMRDETGTLLIDWMDHLVVPSKHETRLRALGYTEDEHSFYHPEAMLPRVIMGEDPVLAIRVDSIADFAAAHGVVSGLEGDPFSQYRRVRITPSFEAVERRGYRGFQVANHTADNLKKILQAAELWKTRLRQMDDFRPSLAVLNRVIDMVGRDMACHIVFAEERAYWERRNRAGRVQKRRQDALGLGWANHDHHTFRSSREQFIDLMQVLERLGFERRERYYAGAQAGWGAQILEQPVEGIVAFCDVDLEPEETEVDFSRHPLPPSKKLGTIGLWVGLHGESFLQAGMHHLECRFDYALLREQLAAQHVNTMKPFSDFPFLKQAFTEGERWPVRRERAERLLRARLITEAQFREFITQGAIGSHLENLQRKGGFKGFNQKSVSVIIQATDPRSQPSHA
ncbi:MAG TPA: hypothetical protein VJ063_08715 [Verrucomicrobiae bacterium]|nr:hypothetical protein [Verrucomicrobiae bacterium]